MAKADKEKRQELEKRFEKFVKEADLYYRNKFNSRYEHLFVAGSSYREGSDVVEFSMGVASSDGYEGKIMFPIHIKYDPIQRFGDIDSLLNLSDPQFNYWLTRTMDYSGDVYGYVWKADKEYPTEHFDMYDLCQDILTGPECQVTILERSDLAKFSYNEKVSMGARLVSEFLKSENIQSPEAYGAMKHGLDLLGIQERRENVIGIMEGKVSAAEHIITQIRNKTRVQLILDDFEPERLGLETYIAADLRNRDRERKRQEGRAYEEVEKQESSKTDIENLKKCTRENYDINMHIANYEGIGALQYHDRLIIGVELTKGFVNLEQFHDFEEFRRYHEAIDNLDLQLSNEVEITAEDFQMATDCGGEHLIGQVIGKDFDACQTIDKDKFCKLANQWLDGEREKEKELDGPIFD